VVVVLGQVAPPPLWCHFQPQTQNPNHPLNPSKKTNSHGSQWANKLASFPKVPVAFSA